MCHTPGHREKRQAESRKKIMGTALSNPCGMHTFFVVLARRTLQLEMVQSRCNHSLFFITFRHVSQSENVLQNMLCFRQKCIFLFCVLCFLCCVCVCVFCNRGAKKYPKKFILFFLAGETHTPTGDGAVIRTQDLHSPPPILRVLNPIPNSVCGGYRVKNRRRDPQCVKLMARHPENRPEISAWSTLPAE